MHNNIILCISNHILQKKSKIIIVINKNKIKPSANVRMFRVKNLLII